MDFCSIEASEYHRHHTFWGLESLERARRVSSGASVRHRSRYAVRELRYWFMDHLIRREYAVQKRPLTICEVGVGSGGLLKFVTGLAVENEENKLPSWIVSWDGVSRRVDPAALRGIGYTGCVELNLEDSKLELHQAYDVMVLLHVLEHLHKPETVLARLLPFVKAGGIIVGGAPTLPDVFRSLRERQLRKDAQPFGHVSVISPNRLRQAALRLQLSVEFLTGAYLLRATGSCLESSRTWLRFNLLFGALCPSWPGEIYWMLRKA